MYKAEKTVQLTFAGFNQSCGMELDPDDEWVRLADAIDWNAVEERYRRLFPSRRGRPAVSARAALGALVIQRRKGLSDRELVREIRRNPYYQYFIGMEAFSRECPFRHGVLPEFRRRFDMDFLVAVNEEFLASAPPTAEHRDDGKSKKGKKAKGVAKNAKKANVRKANGGGDDGGTLILDATCSPSDVRFPQDFSLLNEAREDLDAMIDRLHAAAGDAKRPRTYRRKLRKAHLAMAKAKRRPAKAMRAHVRVMLNAVERNLGFVDAYLAHGVPLRERDLRRLDVLRELHRQQREMFDRRVHRVKDRIVSIRQPFVRPIVRGKAKSPTEFGAKYDVSVDEKGHARLERASFDAYNECAVLQDAVERYKARTDRYPKRVLVDQIYRTKENREWCEARGVRMSGRRGGRPPADAALRRAAARLERADDADRIEVERHFSLSKRKCGAALVVTRLSETSLASIALSVLVSNLFGAIPRFFLLFVADSPDGSTSWHFIEFPEDGE